MPEGVDKNGRGEFDLGADRDTRVQLCTKHAWCVLPSEHEGPCHVAPRTSFPKPDFMPRKK